MAPWKHRAKNTPKRTSNFQSPVTPPARENRSKEPDGGGSFGDSNRRPGNRPIVQIGLAHTDLAAYPRNLSARRLEG